MKGPYQEVGSGRVFMVSDHFSANPHLFAVAWPESPISPAGSTVLTAGVIADLVEMGLWKTTCTGCGRVIEGVAIDSGGWHFGACCMGGSDVPE